MNIHEGQVPNLHHGNNLIVGNPNGLTKGIHVSVLNHGLNPEWVTEQYKLYNFIYLVTSNGINYLVWVGSDYAHFTSRNYSLDNLRDKYNQLNYYTKIIKEHMQWTDEQVSLIGYTG